MAAASTSKSVTSGRLQGLRFMQRAKVREEVLKKQEAEEVGGAPVDESHWVTPAASAKCRVIIEGDPKPGASLGRMSFQNFNPAVEKIVEEVEARRERLRNAASTLNGEKDISNVKAAQQVDRNDGEPGAAEEADISKISMRKRQKVEKVETAKVLSVSSVSANVKSEADRRLQQHETKQVNPNRDWRHLRPPGR